MRKSTQALMGLASLASVITGWEVGASAKTTGFTTTPVATDTNTPVDTPTDTATATPSTKPTTTPKPSTSPTTSPTNTPAPVQTVTRTSDPVYYRFGTVQLSVTKSGSKITDINLDQAGATNGRGSAFPYLVQQALAAQSANFDTSMMSGATYTTMAFQQALDNALGKF